MKTVTFSDEAYDRLKSWKDSGRESFSSVVLRVVPKRGTAADLNDAFRELPVLRGEHQRLLDEDRRPAEGGVP